MKTYSWEQVKVETWAAMTPQERAECEAARGEVEMQLRVAELVYQARHDAGLTQKQLADKAGLSQACVSALETGLRSPRVLTLTTLLDAAGKELQLSSVERSERRQR
jgi:ribosome-binding protein aMBF1 (putative translation factor)